MKKYIVYFFSVLLCITGYSQNDFAVISSRIREQVCKETNDQTLLKNVVSFLPMLRKDGSWADIDYRNKDIAKWKPGNHLDRIKIFSQALIKESNFYYNNAEVRNAIVAALRYWYAENPKSNNWWHNEIASPQSLGEILILMQQSNQLLPLMLQDSLVQLMKQGNVFEKTGANKLDIALHMIYRACITKDKALMDTAVQQAFQPIVLTSEEGIQYDNSYLQHGPQLQISSYGLVFLSGEYKVASWVQGTSYALKGEQLKILNSYFLNTFLPAIRGRYIDFNTEGRGISRKDILDKKNLAVFGKNNTLLELAKTVSPENTAIINAAIERISQQKGPNFSVIPKHSYYWKADYTQHLRPAYTFNVRTVSIRTKRTEAGNKENLIGKFLPDGSTNIQRSGSEYFNIMPVWEWDKIPGVTSRDFKEDEPIITQWGEQGNTVFAGGVSDSVYGVTCYDMDYNGVKAKKAWFFFDKEVVCLGAGISSTTDENVTTTINQCWLAGNVKMFASGKPTTAKNKVETNGAKWVWHDSIGYYFLSPANISITTQNQKGSWGRINSSQPKEALEGDVFKLWLNHGNKPFDSSYAYSVSPAVGLDEMSSNSYSAFKIVHNNSKIQAVYHEELDMLQVVFYQPGEVSINGFKLNTSESCTVLVKQVNNKQPSIWIADPSQKLKKIIIKVKVAGVEKNNEIVCEMPKGNYLGSSKYIDFLF